MVSALISRVVILVFGTLYPAYSSYKAVKTKNVKEYVKWMMYWIVFAIFTSVETFADVLVSWFPFYYELKIIFVIWLLSPATKGSSILYRRFVHPELLKREEEIDSYLERVKTQGYSALLNVGTQGLNLAVQGALTGQTRIIDQLKKSYSLGDLSKQPGERNTYQPAVQRIPEDEPDYVCPPVDDQGQSENIRVEKLDAEKPYKPSLEPSGHSATASRHSDYNLRSQEYHGAEKSKSSNSSSAPVIDQPKYSHDEGYHYGTLPRRSASMRSHATTTALPSRWRRSAIE